MSRYCLDTVTYSHFKRGHTDVVALLDQAEWIGVPVTVIGELCAGFGSGARMRENMAELDEFLATPVVETLPVDRSVALVFGEMVAELRRLGRPIPVNDVWIAATCAQTGATLVTFDAHFQALPRIGKIILK